MTTTEKKAQILKHVMERAGVPLEEALRYLEGSIQEMTDKYLDALLAYYARPLCAACQKPTRAEEIKDGLCAGCQPPVEHVVDREAALHSPEDAERAAVKRAMVHQFAGHACNTEQERADRLVFLYASQLLCMSVRDELDAAPAGLIISDEAQRYDPRAKERAAARVKKCVKPIHQQNVAGFCALPEGHEGRCKTLQGMTGLTTEEYVAALRES